MSAGWRGSVRPLTTVTTALAATLALVALPATSAQAATTTITVNGTGTGRVFNGIGAISGGGGNTRLLIDYPAPSSPRSSTTCSSPATAPRCRSSRSRSAATPTPPTARSPASSTPGRHRLQHRLRVVADASRPRPATRHQVLRPRLGRARLDRRRELLVHRHDHLHRQLAGLRQAQTACRSATSAAGTSAATTSPGMSSSGPHSTPTATAQSR